MSKIYSLDSILHDPTLIGIPDQPEVGASDIQVNKLEDLQDGSSIYNVHDLMSEQEEAGPQRNFHENIAEFMSDSELSGLASKLLEGIQNDKESRQEWENTIDKAYKYLGIKVEESRNTPFLYACSAFDTTLTNALYKSYSICMTELCPSAGPAKAHVKGYVTDEKVNQSEAVVDLINQYLTITDRAYYPDFYRMIINTIFYGIGCKKVYMDPVTGMPVSRQIDPFDLIIDNKCTSILNSSRITYVFRLSPKDIYLKQESGEYVDFEVPDTSNDDKEEESKIGKTIRKTEGIDTDTSENKSQFKFYEVHADLRIKDVDDEVGNGKIPLPYIVTLNASNRKIVAIRRNWKEGDNKFSKKRFFVIYNYFQGFGIYGVGLAHLIGSNAIVLTSVTRQLIDAGTLKNFPGGLRVKGMKLENNDKAIGPSEFRELETGGLPIQQAIMPMPYPEPSTVLLELSKILKEETMNLAGLADIPVAETPANTPVGTTLALLDITNRAQSCILRSMRNSLSEELELLYELFAENMSDEPYIFDVAGGERAVTRQFFNKSIGVVPVADADLTTRTHRILNTEAILKLANTAPDLHDRREVYHRMYESMGVRDIDKILPKPQEAIPLDPITENMNAMTGKPLKAALIQDHNAHIMVHTQYQQMPLMAAHIQEHQAMQYFIEMQNSMGIEMPNPQLLANNIEMQNAIAMKAAEVSKQKMEQAAANQPKPLDPNVIMMADIKQKEEAARLKAEETKQRAETEAYKSKLKYESEMAKIEAQREMADDKNEVNLAIAETKVK